MVDNKTAAAAVSKLVHACRSRATTRHRNLLPPAPAYFDTGRYKTQKFNSVASQTSGSLLLLAAISILIPTAAQQLGTGGGPAEKALDALIGAPMPLDKVCNMCLAPA